MSDKNPLERAEAAISVAQRAIKKVTGVDERVDELETQVEQLEYELGQMREQAEVEERLFADVRQGMANKPEERAATLIQALNNEACTDASVGRAKKAEMDVAKARTALGGSIIRQSIYPTFDRAVDLVDDKRVLEYVKEDRGSDRNSRLRLNLEGDRELPDRVAGFDIRDPTGTSDAEVRE